MGASSAAAAALSKAYQTAAEWQKLYRDSSPTGRQVACSTSPTSLCGRTLSLGASATPLALGAQVTLQLATAPARYDVRTFPHPANPRLNKAFDQQQCSVCVAAAVAAAAETTVASVMKVPASRVRLSRSFLYWCSKYGSDNSCASGWDVEKALNALKEQPLPSPRCAPNKGLTLFEDGRRDLICPDKQCPETLAAQGTFTWRRISTFWEAQDHIRMYGAVISRMVLHVNDTTGGYHLRDFYTRNPSDTPYSVSSLPKGSATEGHAVVLVGYDNDAKHWMVLNSWGAKFAQQGVYVVSCHRG